MRRVFSVIAAIAVCAVGTQQAEAAFLFDGKTVGYEYHYDDLGEVIYSANLAVGAGIELGGLSNGSDAATVNISDTNITLDFFNPLPPAFLSGTFNGIRIFDFNNTLESIVAVTINPLTNLVGFDASRITFDANNIYINFANIPVNADSVFSLDVTPAPAPASLLLWGMGGGLAFLGKKLRRGRKTEAAA